MLMKTVFPLCLLALVTACDGGSSAPTIDRTPPTVEPNPAPAPTNIILSEAVVLGTDDLAPVQTSGAFPLKGMWIFTEKRTPYDNSGQRLTREVVYVDDQAAKLYRCGDQEGVDFSTSDNMLSSDDEQFSFAINDEKNRLSASYAGDEDNPFTAEFDAIKITNDEQNWSDLVQLTVNSFSSDELTLSATDIMASCYNYSYLVQTDEDNNKSETAVIALVSAGEASTMSFDFSTQVYTTPDGADDDEQYGLTFEISDLDGKTVAHFLNDELTGSPSFSAENSSFTGSITGDNNSDTIDLTLTINLNP
ncbi:hypothetical protein SIN8267_02862 [Sinobacterium norvegicum]|uniref:Lipoprotein n=1 Tax=Sinobacterium norvegicum TaxID=1641715 RepID=A0ABN8ER48_9GAMM|nr:hypothetical protein [Sinobacterium norvegicum]CAH0992726.1 hypothetical protein SIN8267_02862 [Sinobacterium norvegicum]